MVNISLHILTNIELSALNKGLSFFPTSQVDWFGLELDIYHLFRKIKLKTFFGRNTGENVMTRSSEIMIQDTGLSKKSDFTPIINSPPIDTFITVKNSISKLREQGNFRISRANMSKKEQAAIEQISQNDLLTLKGGALVIMDTSFYANEIHRQLNDREVYKIIDRDPKFQLGHMIKQLVDEAYMAGIIDKHLQKYLIVENPTTPVIYVLPKIHKDANHPPGRPIVSGCNSIFNPIAIFLDKILQKFAGGAKSYIKNTPDFLRKLQTIEDVTHCTLV